MKQLRFITQRRHFAIGKGLWSAVIFIGKMYTVERAQHIAEIIYIGDIVHPFCFVANGVIAANGNTGLVKITMINRTVLAVGIITAYEQTEFTKGISNLYIGSFITIVIYLYA